MAIHVRDRETDVLVRRLATETKLGITDAIRRAVANELERIESAKPLEERIAPIIARIRAHKVKPKIESDKDFWDDLSGDY